jgi:hypothetical protein
VKRSATAKGKQAPAARASKKPADGAKAAGKARATKKRRANGKPAAKSATKPAAANGAPAPEDRHGHTKVGAPAETDAVAPVDDLTRGLTAEQRGLLGDLFAVIGEHEDESLAPIDRDAVQHAFVFACDRHADQMRKSGDEFITHPVGVAQICAGMRLDSETLCAALLHDTVEDTSASLEEIDEGFGTEVAQLVDGVTKLTGITFESRDERQAENYRKMMIAVATDVRVILIKLADRLHNMRTLSALSKQKQIAKARETLETWRSRPCTPASTTRSRSSSPSSDWSASATSRMRASSSPRSWRRSASRPRSQAAPSTSTRSTRR